MTNLSIRKLSKQPWDFGTLYSYTPPENTERGGRSRIFVFNNEKDFVERELGGLEGIVKFEEEYYPGDFEHDVVNIGTEEQPKYVFVKGHPYQSLVTLHRIEQAMPQSEKYELIPLRKYFGTNDIIVTEYILDPSCEFDGIYLFSVMDLESTFVRDDKSGESVAYPPEAYRRNRDGRGGYVENVIDDLLERARQSSEGMEGLRRYIQNHPEGGDDYFKRRAYDCRYGAYSEQEQFKFSERLGNIKAEDVLPFAEEALDALYADLEKAGKKLRMSHHIDPRPSNVFFRGMNNGKFQFTLIDQYHCGSDELRHHQRKYGGGPILRMGP